MGHEYLCRRSGEAREERRSCGFACVLTSIHVHPSIHQGLGHPLCVHLTRNLQGADKEDHPSIEESDKGQPVGDVKKNQLLLLLLIFFLSFLQPHPLPSLTPAGFLAICTFPKGSRVCPCWAVGGWGGGKASQGLVLFLNSSARWIQMVHFWCSHLMPQISHTSWMPPAFQMSPPALYPWITYTR